MLLKDLVATSQRVASTAGRNDKAALLAELLRALDREEIPFAVAALAGHVRQGRIGVGAAALRAAQAGIGQHAGASPAPLTLRAVDADLERLARIQGPGSTRARAATLAELFTRASDAERSFLTRLLLGDVRQGALGGVMEDAVSRASGVALSSIRRAAMLAGDLDAVAVAALRGGDSALAPFRLALFRPVRPMLAQPAESIDDALARNAETAFETKVDGARVQIHRDGRRVAVYSRQLNDVTAGLPEVVSDVRALPLDDACSTARSSR